MKVEPVQSNGCHRSLGQARISVAISSMSPLSFQPFHHDAHRATWTMRPPNMPSPLPRGRERFGRAPRHRHSLGHWAMAIEVSVRRDTERGVKYPRL